jgi:hypothetical protein
MRECQNIWDTFMALLEGRFIRTAIELWIETFQASQVFHFEADLQTEVAELKSFLTRSSSYLRRVDDDPYHPQHGVGRIVLAKLPTKLAERYSLGEVALLVDGCSESDISEVLTDVRARMVELLGDDAGRAMEDEMADLTSSAD